MEEKGNSSLCLLFENRATVLGVDRGFSFLWSGHLLCYCCSWHWGSPSCLRGRALEFLSVTLGHNMHGQNLWQSDRIQRKITGLWLVSGLFDILETFVPDFYSPLNHFSNLQKSLHIIGTFKFIVNLHMLLVNNEKISLFNLLLCICVVSLYFSLGCTGFLLIDKS